MTDVLGDFALYQVSNASEMIKLATEEIPEILTSFVRLVITLYLVISFLPTKWGKATKHARKGPFLFTIIIFKICTDLTKSHCVQSRKFGSIYS